MGCRASLNVSWVPGFTAVFRGYCLGEFRLTHGFTRMWLLGIMVGMRLEQLSFLLWHPLRLERWLMSI